MLRNIRIEFLELLILIGDLVVLSFCDWMVFECIFVIIFVCNKKTIIYVPLILFRFHLIFPVCKKIATYNSIANFSNTKIFMNNKISMIICGIVLLIVYFYTLNNYGQYVIIIDILLDYMFFWKIALRDTKNLAEIILRYIKNLVRMV